MTLEINILAREAALNKGKDPCKDDDDDDDDDDEDEEDGEDSEEG